MAKLMVAGAPAGVRKKRKGIHSKTKTSPTKTTKNYKKPYKGQGR